LVPLPIVDCPAVCVKTAFPPAVVPMTKSPVRLNDPAFIVYVPVCPDAGPSVIVPPVFVPPVFVSEPFPACPIRIAVVFSTPPLSG
jgi:hypothetical protein